MRNPIKKRILCSFVLVGLLSLSAAHKKDLSKPLEGNKLLELGWHPRR